MNETVDANLLPKEYRKPLSRRKFLDLGKKATVASLLLPILSACGVSPSVSPPNTVVTSEPALPKEGAAIFQESVILDFDDRAEQEVTWVVDKNNQKTYPKECSKPYISSDLPPSGKQQDMSEYDWQKHNFDHINFRGITYPILARNEAVRRYLELLRQPGWLQGEIDKVVERESLAARLKEVRIDPLLLIYDGIRDRYWKQQSDAQSGCILYENRSKKYDPAQLYQQLGLFFKQATAGNLIFLPGVTESVDEKSLPFTTDPSLAPQRALDWYGKSVNHKNIANMARSQGKQIAIVFGPPSLGMMEHILYDGCTIIGLNYERNVDMAVESLLHLIDTRNNADDCPFGNLFYTWSGRNADMNFLPYGEIKGIRELESTVFAAAGYGGVHFSPNGFEHYNYTTPVQVILPDSDKSEICPWVSAKNPRLEYFRWWLGKMPSAFYQYSFLS